MSMIKIAQALPFLEPLLIRQKKYKFYRKLENDCNKYSVIQEKLDKRYKVTSKRSPLINKDWSIDIQHQINKTNNLRIARLALHNLQIKPGETFSFWHTIKRSYKYGNYKEGPMLVNDKILIAETGGLCQLSKELYWSFLHSDLEVIENHSNKKQPFHVTHCDIPMGLESSVYEGLQDLQVRNDTMNTYQIDLQIDNNYLYVSLFTTNKDYHKYYIIEKDNYFYTYERFDYYHNKIFKQKYINNYLVDEVLIKENNILLKYNFRQYINIDII